MRMTVFAAATASLQGAPAAPGGKPNLGALKDPARLSPAIVWDKVPMFADRAREIGRDAAFAELAAMATPLGRYATADVIARLTRLAEEAAQEMQRRLPQQGRSASACCW